METTTKSNGMIRFAIDGMTCGHCVQAVTKALSAVPGMKVQSVAVGWAVIEASDGLAAGKAVAALEEAGYPARTTRDGAAKEPDPRTGSGGGCCGGSIDAAPGAKAGPGTAGVCC